MLLHESAASMEQSMPENLSTHVYGECEVNSALTNCSDSDPVESDRDLPTKDSCAPTAMVGSPSATTKSTTKVKLSFSVDRLLGSEPGESERKSNSSPSTRSCCDGGTFACCSFPHCFSQANAESRKIGHAPIFANAAPTSTHPYVALDRLYPSLYMDYKSVLRPTPLRAAEHASPTYPTLATNALLRFHQHQKQQHQQHHHQPHHPKHLHQQQKPPQHIPTTAAGLLAPLHSLTTLQLTQQQRFMGKTQQQLLDVTPTSPAGPTLQNGGHPQQGSGSTPGNGSANNNGKRKRSWSRAVFTNLQRKGLEIQFQQQKYITKPDRRKLAARLNLTDAQVKVWFQNRRMKWRHTRENLKSGQEKQPTAAPGAGSAFKASTASGSSTPRETLDYSSDSCSSVDLSEQADDDDSVEINVVE